MQPITKQDQFFEYQFLKIVEEQKKTNDLLQQLLDILKPPVKEVEPIEPVRHDSTNKRKRR